MGAGTTRGRGDDRQGGRWIYSLGVISGDEAQEEASKVDMMQKLQVQLNHTDWELPVVERRKSIEVVGERHRSRIISHTGGDMPQRYQREIEEILQQAGDLGADEAPKRRPRMGFARLVWDYFKQSIGGSPLSITPGRVMLAAVLILLAALVLNATSSSFVGLLAWLGFILFIVGYAMFFIKPRPVEKRWRGSVIQYEDESLWDRIRKRFR